MPNPLFTQFLISTIMLVGCVVFHGFGLALLNRAVRSEAALERLRNIDPLSRRGALFTLSIVLTLIVLHGLEIWSFAALYLSVDAVHTVEEAIYFSTISYSTVGYNDTHIATDWRLVGAFESILGMILLGWSTAFFFRMLGRIDAH